VSLKSAICLLCLSTICPESNREQAIRVMIGVVLMVWHNKYSLCTILQELYEQDGYRLDALSVGKTGYIF